MRKIGQLLIIVIIIVMMLPGITAWANDNLHIYFVDVGQADAAIIACDDNVLMIDGGNVADSQLIFSVLRNTLGIEHINYMIATPPTRITSAGWRLLSMPVQWMSCLRRYWNTTRRHFAP